MTLEAKRKILVVDDAEMFRELGALFLGRSGEVVTAEDGVEALALASEIRPDVIVTDISMPRMTGDELCAALKADPDLANIPVIAVTAHTRGDERDRAIRAGARDVLEKPLNRAQLIMAVNHYLRIATRGLARVPLETDVHIHAGAHETWARSRNVSRGGIFLEVEGTAPEPSSEVTLSFELPEMSGGSIASTARVMWRNPVDDGATSGMGLRFLKLERSAAQTLHDFVYERAAPEDIAAENRPPL